MNKAINDGGPAFPGENETRFGQPNDCNPGMTLRDYFAAKAMEVHLAAQWAKFYRLPKDESETNPFEVFDQCDVCEMAYEVADAMLKARSA